MQMGLFHGRQSTFPGPSVPTDQDVSLLSFYPSSYSPKCPSSWGRHWGSGPCLTQGTTPGPYTNSHTGQSAWGTCRSQGRNEEIYSLLTNQSPLQSWGCKDWRYYFGFFGGCCVFFFFFQINVILLTLIAVGKAQIKSYYQKTWMKRLKCVCVCVLRQER